MLSPSPALHFVKGSTIHVFEDALAEFKAAQAGLPTEFIRKLVRKYVICFLNTYGGRLYLGIDNDGTVLGVLIDRGARDAFEAILRTNIAAICPRILPDVCKLTYHAVVPSFGSPPIPHEYVITIDVTQGDEKPYFFNNESRVRFFSHSPILSDADATTLATRATRVRDLYTSLTGFYINPTALHHRLDITSWSCPGFVDTWKGA